MRRGGLYRPPASHPLGPLRPVPRSSPRGAVTRPAWPRCSSGRGKLEGTRLLQELAPPRRFLLLPLHTRLLIMLAPPRLRQNALLLDLLVETLQSRFETLVVTDCYFGQPLSPPIKSHVAGMPNQGGTRRDLFA